jgi:hypothetical protein
MALIDLGNRDVERIIDMLLGDARPAFERKLGCRLSSAVLTVAGMGMR